MTTTEDAAAASQADLARCADPNLEQLLTRYQVPATLAWIPPDAVDWAETDRRKVRADLADPATVHRYAMALEAGAVLPAGLAVPSNEEFDPGVWIAAGVHRAKAYADAGRHVPAYLARTDAPERGVWMVAVASNARHGLPLSLDEQVEQALAMLDAGVTQAEAAEVCGLSVAKLRAAVSARKSGEVLARYGMAAQWAKIPRSGQWRLGMAAAGDAEVLMEAVATARALELGTAGCYELGAAITAAKAAAGPEKAAQAQAAILAVEDFDEVHRTSTTTSWRGGGGSGGGGSAGPATPVHRFRDHHRSLLQLDAGEIVDRCMPGDIPATVDLARRSAAHTLAVIRALEGKAARQEAR